MKIKDLQIAVDFDGTLTKGNYFPEISEPLLKGINFLIKLQEYGAKIYLDTMRSGKYLDEAIEFCQLYGLKFDSIGPSNKQKKWTTSNKCHADYSIDDRNIGIPLLYDENNKPYVDWNKLITIFKERLKID